MNTFCTNQHLSSDDVIKAMVDRNDLAADRRAHLDECARCRERVSQFECRLAGIGKMARETAPASSRPFRLPRTESRRHWQTKPIFAAGAAALVLLAVVMWSPDPASPPEVSTVASIDAAEDRQLIEDIDAIVENALPEAYQELATFDMPDWSADDLEDDPSDWIVPSLQEEEDEYEELLS